MGAIYDAINKLKAHRSKLFNDKKKAMIMKRKRNTSRNKHDQKNHRWPIL